MKKDMVIFDMLVNGKSKMVNFCNIFCIPELEYNFLLVDTIKKAGYSILAKKRK